MQKELSVLFIGDIIGSLGRSTVKELLPEIKKRHKIDLTIANGENSAHGYSITENIYKEFMAMGIDALTMGNHVWEKREVVQKIALFEKMARPANYPKGAPGNEFLIVEAGGVKVGILNLLGRVFMQCVDCPFQAAEALLPKIRKEAQVIIVDIHGEATSEKAALGFFLDGKVSAVLGTHTHVMTADDRILPSGTAFISDVGMVGALDSIIGMNKEQIIKRFTTQLPEKFEPTDTGRALFNAVLMKIDAQTGVALEIKKIKEILEPAA
ncbi:MAG TPA: TIGR00282 family metallophosphoesterase [Candidatus Omnitrophota bacterium]|nr:TIGR00282 family metallophosphoesterase [Candidatus Omnitrophota bacterium]